MKGHVILGVFSGLLFGLFLGPTLWLWGVIPLASPLMWILPLVGLILGIIMAAWAPFGKGPEAVNDQESGEGNSEVLEDEPESVDHATESVATDRSEEE